MEEQKEQPKQEESTTTLIETARKVAERIEQANKRTEELLKRQEEIEARKIISGRSSAGTTIAPPIDPQVEVKNRVNEMLKGTGLKI